jgi:hypothetical protein
MGNLFFDPEAGPDAAPSVPIPSFTPFTKEELDEARSRFRGSASSGICPLPSQLVKYMAGDALEPLATFLNHCVAGARPPTAWRQLKLVPLYKNRGDRGDPDNYRGLAVGHPMAKLAMGVINQRLQTLADEGGLRAPTQAGFRPGYTVEELALVLSVCI